MSPLLVDQLTCIAFNSAQLRHPDPVTAFSRSSTEMKLHRFFAAEDVEAGVGSAAGGADTGGVGVAALAGGIVAEGGAGVDADFGGGGVHGWAEEEEPPPDIEAADVDAIVAELWS